MGIHAQIAAIAICGCAAGAVTPAFAQFEIKGIETGQRISQISLAECEKVADADSGLPGYSCRSTLGGDPAMLRIVVHDDTVAAFIFHVKNAHTRNVLSVLEEKFGKSIQTNPYIEDYMWNKGKHGLFLSAKGLTNGYSLSSVDMDLVKQAQEAVKNKLKRDF